MTAGMRRDAMRRMVSRCRSRSVTLCCVLEEMGSSQGIDIEFEVNIDVQPEERPVIYDRDGSGYPGCPGSLEVCGVRVMKVRSEDWQLSRYERSDWFDFLDAIVLAAIQDEADEWDDRFREILSDMEDC